MSSEAFQKLQGLFFRVFKVFGSHLHVAKFDVRKVLGNTSHSHVAVFDFLRERGGLKSFAGSIVRSGLRLLARSKV